MDGSSSTSLKSPKSENQPKKRKVEEKTVVRVKNEGKKKGEDKQKKTVPPPDSWAWRKYGQKPVKGSPHKKGYYKCSTAKDCLARKQVERCKEDDSMLIITYTSAHNHPSPDTQIPQKHQTPKKKPKVQVQAQAQAQAHCEPTTPEPCNSKDSEQNSPCDHQEQFSCIQSPNHSLNDTQKIDKHEEVEEPYVVNLDNITPNDSFAAFCHLKNLPTSRPKDEHCDFFDELNDLDLQSSSSFTSFMRSKSNVLEERILVHPS